MRLNLIFVFIIVLSNNKVIAQNYFNKAQNNFRYSFTYPNQSYQYYNNDYSYCNVNSSDSNYVFFLRSEDAFIFNSDNLHIDLNILKVDDKGDSLWLKNYNFSDYGYELVLSAIECDDKGIICVGYITDTLGTNTDSIDGFILKIDENGDYLWHKRYDLGKGNKFLKIKTKDNGQTFNIVGFSDVGVAIIDYEILYLTIDSIGNIINIQQLGEYDWDIGRDFNYLNDGGVLIAGETYSHASGTLDRTDVYLLKIDSIGNILWRNRYGYPGWDNTWGNQCLWLDENENAYIAASHEAMDGNYKAWLIKTNPQGDTLWTKMYDNGPYYDDFLSISKAKDGNLILLGATDNYLGESHSNCLLTKIDTLGEIIWNRNIIKYNVDNTDLYPYSMSIDLEGNILLSGYVINNSIQSNGIFHRNDAWLCKTDSCGFTTGAQPHALLTVDSVVGNTVYITNLSEEYCTAQLFFGNGDGINIYAYSQYANGSDPTQIQYTFADTGTYNLTLYSYAGDALDTFTTQVDIIDTETGIVKPFLSNVEGSIAIYPNPSQDYIILSLDESMMPQSYNQGMYALKGEIYTITGQKVQSFFINPKLLQQRIFLDNLSNTVYLISISLNDRVIANKRINVLR